LAPPAPAAVEAAAAPPAIAPPPREEVASAPAAPAAALPPHEPLPPAVAATSVVLGDATRWALGAAAPDAVVAPGPRRDADSRGAAVSSGASIGGDGGEKVGARQSHVSALARSGRGADDSAAAYTGYLTGLRHRIQEALRYPLPARRRGLTGTVTIELTVLPNGAIGPVAVVESSAHPLLDEAALETVQSLRAEPFPAGLPPRMLRVRLPVVFQLR
jgi:protein TonB